MSYSCPSVDGAGDGVFDRPLRPVLGVGVSKEASYGLGEGVEDVAPDGRLTRLFWTAN